MKDEHKIWIVILRFIGGLVIFFAVISFFDFINRSHTGAIAIVLLYVGAYAVIRLAAGGYFKD